MLILFVGDVKQLFHRDTGATFYIQNENLSQVAN